MPLRPPSAVCALPARPARVRRWALLGLAACLAGCPGQPPRRPNVLLVVIDTLRADRLGAYGNRRGLTPFLDQLAQRGTLFEHAYAPSSWTIPSVASLFTSRYPSQHRVVTFGNRIGDGEVTFAERLRDAGWIGAGYSANPNVHERWGHAQGFAELRTTEAVKGDGDTLRAWSLAWLDRSWSRGAATPAFLYFQYMEPHEPYQPAEPFRSRFAVDDFGNLADLQSAVIAAARRTRPDSDGAGKPPPDFVTAVHELLAQGEDRLNQVIRLSSERQYDGGVAEADDQMRRLFEELERRGFLDHAVVIITSDHGEELFEHGGTSHGHTLYEESVRVPLIIVGPGVPAGRRVAGNVSLVDVAPTLLDLLVLPPEPRFERESLLPRLAAETTPSTRGDPGVPDIVLQLEQKVPPRLERRKHTRGLVRGTGKLLVERVGERSVFYDLAADPGETAGDPPGSAGQSAALSQGLAEVQTHLGQRAEGVQTPVALDAKTREQLKALGYAP